MIVRCRHMHCPMERTRSSREVSIRPTKLIPPTARKRPILKASRSGSPRLKMNVKGMAFTSPLAGQGCCLKISMLYVGWITSNKSSITKAKRLGLAISLAYPLVGNHKRFCCNHHHLPQPRQPVRYKEVPALANVPG